MEYILFGSVEEMKNILGNKKPRLVRAGNKNICVVLLDEKLFAFENECPHMGESLHNGNINHLNEIVCPLHSYRFNVITGNSSHSCSPLKKVKVKQDNEVVLLL